MNLINKRKISDTEYIARRNIIANIANSYVYPNPVPDVIYTPQEHQLWSDIQSTMAPIHRLYAHSAYLSCLNAVTLPSDHIPQLSEINKNLKISTAYQLSPVSGLIDSRKFMSALADNRMFCTQYIRHHSTPDYTPEPDIIHELLGHVVLFFSKEYCDLNIAFGRAALKASDADMKKIERLYWYTIEFGLIKENNTIKAYGAGLLSSIGELLNINNVTHAKFCIKDIIETPYDTENMQPVLFCAESYEEMKEETYNWLEKIK